MQTRPFGNTDLHVTPLGFGSAPIGFLDTERQCVADMLAMMLDSGVNVIDTAACYPGSEAMIGQTISDRRDEYVLVSKCGHRTDDATAQEWSAQLITASIDRSLQRMKTDHVDVMLLHSCGRDTLEKGDALGAVLRAVEAGKVRYAGYSGDNETAAFATTLEGVRAIETSISIADQVNIEHVLSQTRKLGQGVLAKRPIANAAWKKLDQQEGMYQSYAAKHTERLRRMRLDPLALGIEDLPRNASAETVWPEVALRFTLSFSEVHSAIIGTTKADNARGNISASEKGPLPAHAVAAIRKAFSEAQTAAGESWPGLT